MSQNEVGGSSSKTFLKRIFGFSMASWVNCLISLFSTPITTALFLPAELGKVNLFISYINILVPFAYMGFDQAYVRFHKEPPGKNTDKSLFKLCFIISMLLAAAVSVVVMLFWKPFSENIIGYGSLLIAFSLVVYLFAFVILRYTNLKARMENNIWSFFFQSVATTVVIKLSFVAVALVHPSAAPAIVFRSCLLLVVAAVFLLIALLSCRRHKTDVSLPVVKEMSKYAIPLFPTIFLVMLNTSLAQIFLENFVDYTSIGIFSNAVTIAGIITIVQSGLNTFWTPFVYEYYEQKQKLQKMHHIIAFLLIALALGMIFCKDLIYLFLVNKQYWASKAIMPLLLFSPVCETISETLGLGIELSKKTYLKLPVYVINILVNVASCLLLIPRFGIFGAALANALASLSMLVAKSVIGERFYRCSDSYYRLIISMTVLMTVAVANYFLASSYLIYIITAGAILILCVLYQKTLRLLVRTVWRMVREKLFGRRAQ